MRRSDSDTQRVILFDIDGTLLSAGGAGMWSFASACEEVLSIPFDVARSVNPQGKTDPLILSEVLALSSLETEPSPTARERFKSVYLSHLARDLESSDRFRVLPGVPALLEALDRESDIRVGLGTGNWEQGARLKLALGGLEHWFAFGGYGEDGPARPDVLRAGAARSGVDPRPNQVVVIGDTTRDIDAARQAGFRAVAVATGWTPHDELVAAHPDALLEDLTDIRELFGALQG